MAKLNFPDPSVTQTYTEAGITWTWNSVLNVWSSDDIPNDADDRYLRKDSGSPAQTVETSTRTTFNGPLTTGHITLPGGGGPTAAVQRQEVETMIESLSPGVPGVGDITSVVAGDGLEGGGSLGEVTLGVDDTVVRTTGSQEIDGFKTFSKSVTLPGGGTAKQALQKQEIESLIQQTVVTVKAYGAVGDGVADDTNALQAALDAAEGKQLYFPLGKYKITKTLITKPGTRLVGANWSSDWERNWDNGTVIYPVGAGNPQVWTDISGGNDDPITPCIVAGGDAVFFENMSFVSEGSNRWSCAMFFPCVKKCGFSRVHSHGFNKAGVYLDATWSDRNDDLKNRHPEIEPSTGMNEFRGENFWFNGPNTSSRGVSDFGILIQGTKRNPDNYTNDNWIWGWGGTSDIVFDSGRTGGIRIDAAVKNAAKTGQGIRFYSVDSRVGGNGNGIDTVGRLIDLDRVNRVDFFGSYGESTKDHGAICITSRTQRFSAISVDWTKGVVGVFKDGTQVADGPDVFYDDEFTYYSSRTGAFTTANGLRNYSSGLLENTQGFNLGTEGSVVNGMRLSSGRLALEREGKLVFTKDYIVIESPDGTLWDIRVENDGTLTTQRDV